MGFNLRREVRDAIPPGKLSAAERLLVLELADWCNDKTRKGWPGAEFLAELTDLSPRSIQETLSRIATKWIELRVPLGTDKTGKPYYSHAGKRTTFEFPKLTPVKGATDQGACDATDPGASEDEGATDPGGRCDESVPKVRQNRGPSPQGSSSKNTSNPSPLPPTDTDASLESIPGKEGGDGEFDLDQEQRINTLVGEILDLRPNDRRWTTKTVRAAIDKCLTDGKPLLEIERAFPACAMDPDTGAPGRLPLDFYWWALPDPLVPFCAACNDTGVTPYGDGSVEGICQACTPLTDEMRYEFIRTLANYPPCKDGIAGGDVAMPGYGWMYCAVCRHTSGYVPVKAPADSQPRSSQRPQHQTYQNPPDEAYDEWHTRRPPLPRGQHVPYLDPEDLSVYDKPL